MKCAKCGSEMRIGTEQAGIQNGVAVYNRFGYCDRCMEKVNIDALQAQTSNQEKKHSILSIFALIFSLFVITIPISLIFILIDFHKNDKSKKHTCSWIAFINFFIIGFILSIKSENNKNATNQSIVSQESENTADLKQPIQSGYYFYINDLKITVDSINMNYTNYNSVYAPDPGMKYIMVSFTFENTDNSDHYVSIYDFECYADGFLMEQCYYFNNDFINTNLSTGRKVSFNTCYVVPSNSESIELEYKSLAGNSTEVIVLK